MGHRNARLTVHGRQLLVDRVEVEGWSVTATAEAAGVSRATVYKWLHRWQSEGEAGLADRTSRPHHSPRQVAPDLERRILTARRRRRFGGRATTPTRGRRPHPRRQRGRSASTRGRRDGADGVAGAWTYSDARHGGFELEVDDDGIVAHHPGFATRVR